MADKSLMGRDFREIMGFHLVRACQKWQLTSQKALKWKHIQVAIVLQQILRNIAFILGKTVIETHLKSCPGTNKVETKSN